MSDYVKTQLELFLTAIRDYRSEGQSLDAFLERLESPLLFITPFAVRAQLDDLLFEIEATKAISTALGRALSAKERTDIAGIMQRIEAVVSLELITRPVSPIP